MANYSHDPRQSYHRPEDREAEQELLLQRWPDGIPTCPRCGCRTCYDCRKSNGAPRWRCKECRKDFSITSGTLKAFHKKSFVEMIAYRVPPKAMFYPYMPKRSSSVGADLVLEINAAVPRTLPSEIRSDVCQEMAMAVLSGEFDRSAIKHNVEAIIRRIKDDSGFIEYALSLDAPAPGIGTDSFGSGATSFYEAAMNSALRTEVDEAEWAGEYEDDEVPDLRLWLAAA